MKFRTEITPKKPDFEITHRDKTLFVGSCFTENIGNRFIKCGFPTEINPFGIMYNPLSIAHCLKRVAKGELFSKEELVLINGYWKSYSHHGDFRAEKPEECLQKINSALTNAHSFLSDAGFVVLTLGTAWIYRLKESGTLLANCHKLPSGLIERAMAGVEEVVHALDSAFDACKGLNPDLKFILTVSPIRHWREGYRDNTLSKAVLQLAVQEFCSRTSSFYFPAYELLMDDLRDYRFYGSDMLHPSEEAVDYIWEMFGESCFSAATQALAEDFARLYTMLNHRPFNPESQEYKKHLQKAERLKQELYERIK